MAQYILCTKTTACHSSECVVDHMEGTYLKEYARVLLSEGPINSSYNEWKQMKKKKWTYFV